MTLVLDASAAVAVAAAYSSSPLDAADEVLVPDIFIAEITNAVWKIHQWGKTDPLACQSILDEAMTFPSEIVSSMDLQREVLRMAVKERHSVYDLFYLVLARREHAALFTRDKDLLKLAKKHGVAVA